MYFNRFECTSLVLSVVLAQSSSSSLSQSQSILGSLGTDFNEAAENNNKVKTSPETSANHHQAMAGVEGAVASQSAAMQAALNGEKNITRF